MNSLYLIAKESWIQVIDLDRIKVINDADMSGVTQSSTS